MFVFLGSYSGGNDYGSSDDDDSQDDESTDDHSQAGVDDFSGGGGGEDSEQDPGDDEGAAAGVAGAAGAAAGAAGAGAAGGAASGAAAGEGAVTGSPEGKNPEECEDENEAVHESSDVEESDIDQEDNVDEQDHEEDTDEEDADDEEDDHDDDEDEEVVVRQEVDALSAMSWCVQPVMKRVEECYGEEVDIFYRPAPVRDLDPEVEKQKWRECSENLGMPVDPSFWDDDPPESTELVNRAFEAAIQQGRGLEYLRVLWRKGVAVGREISDQEVLVDLASDLGLDTDRFEEYLEDAELETGDRGELPFTYMKIRGQSVPKNGRVRYTDFRTQFTFQGVDDDRPQQLRGFVREHGPVATIEVMEVYEISDRSEAVERLRGLNGVSSFEIGGERFWRI